MRFILGSLTVIYLLAVGIWPAAATPVVLAATGAFTVLLQPPVLLLAGLVALAVHYSRRPAPAAAGRH